MLEELQVERQGRSLPNMVREELQEEGYQFEGLPGVMLYSIDDDTTYSGLLSSEEDRDYLSFQVSVGQQDLPVEDVEAYLEKFYKGQDRVTLWGNKGTRGLHEIGKWADEDGEPQSFYVMFDANPVDQNELETGQLHMNISNYDSWENPEQSVKDTLAALYSVLTHFDRSELAEEEMMDYWTDVMKSNRSKTQIVKDFAKGEVGYPSSIDSLPDIEFDNPDDVRPTVSEIVSAYNDLRAHGWQPIIDQNYDFNATNHSLRAHGFSEEEFDRQLNWIEDRFEISGNNREFTLEIHSMDS